MTTIIQVTHQTDSCNDPPSRSRPEYMIAQYLEQVCTTITVTMPYKSILGNIITRERFPTFVEGVLFKYYGIKDDCDADNEHQIMGWYWTDLLCKTETKSVLAVCLQGKPTWEKYDDSTCSGSHMSYPLVSSCQKPVITGEMTSGLLSPGTIYEYVSVSCNGGARIPALPPSPDPYKVISPVNIPFCFAATELVMTKLNGPMAIDKVKVGDMILAYNSKYDKFQFSTVVVIPHDMTSQLRIEMNLITTESNKSLQLSNDHFLLSCNNQLITAANVIIGNCIRTIDGNESVIGNELVVVDSVTTLVVDDSDYLVVGSMIASPFAVNHWFGNVYYTPHRLMYSIFPNFMKSEVVKILNKFIGDSLVTLSTHLVEICLM